MDSTLHRPQATSRGYENAKRHNRDDVWQSAFRQLCSLEAWNISDPLSRDFYAALVAYEEHLSHKNCRTTRAVRSRQMLKRQGIINCTESWVNSSSVPDGFDWLVKRGLEEYTAEYLTLKYPTSFSVDTVKAARDRLNKHLSDARKAVLISSGIDLSPVS